MRKLQLLLLLNVVFAFNIYAQQLSNTTWEVYDTLGNVQNYFQFTNDTVLFSVSNSNYRAISTYTENGSDFTIADFPPSGTCNVLDTGRFNFTISNDTLDFTLVVDSCINRGNYIHNQIWVKLITVGIEDNQDIALSEHIFPNPTNGLLNIPFIKGLENTTFSIAELSTGKQIFNGAFTNSVQTIDISHLSNGIYILRLANEQASAVKIIKQ